MDSEWLINQFKNNPGKTKAALAVELGLEPPAVSKILNGTRQIKAGEYETMRKFFGLPVYNEAARTTPSVPFAPGTGSGFDEDLSASAGEWIAPGGLLSPGQSGDKTRIFRVNETVMEPDFSMGDQVLVDLSDRRPEPPGMFMVSDGFSHMLRHCEFIANANPPEVKISANGGQFQTQILKLEDFLIVGRVIARLQKI